jgi:hypothetical protein
MRAGHLDLKTAQREIASDWIEAYKKYASVFLVAGGADPLLRADVQLPEPIRWR